MLIEPNSEGRFRQPGSPEDEREFNRERNEELAAALAGEIDWQTRCAELERQNAAMREALETCPHAKWCSIDRDLLDGGEPYCSCGRDAALAHDAGRNLPMNDAALAKFEDDSRKTNLTVGTLSRDQVQPLVDALLGFESHHMSYMDGTSRQPDIALTHAKTLGF